MKIRQATKEDTQAIRDIYQPYIENTNITFETELPSLADFQQRIQNIKAKYPYLVLEEAGKIVGYAYLSSFSPRKAYDPSAEISIYLAEEAQGKGWGKVLCQSLLTEARKQNIVTIYACVAVPNPPSIGLHQALGFEQVAYFEKCAYKHKQWLDVVYLRKLIKDYDDREFIAYPEVNDGKFGF